MKIFSREPKSGLNKSLILASKHNLDVILGYKFDVVRYKFYEIYYNKVFQNAQHTTHNVQL
jgi:hypothetical protein